MKRIDTLVIGAGQAGLAMSRCLSDRGIRHVVLERGEIAQSWRGARWDSLTLLTPNWQSRLPGYAYTGDDPDGFMPKDEVARYLRGYATASRAPVEEHATVRAVTADGAGFRVETGHGDWRCERLVLASGACARASVPALAAAVPAGIDQITGLDYRCPAQLAPGPVLVVGASATGVQLAAEIRAAGHEVFLSAGEHIRAPRSYRGKDIQWWMDRSGILSQGADGVEDLARVRRLPSLQLTGSKLRRFSDLNALSDAGVEVVGRLSAIREGTALFSGGLQNHCALSDLKMNRLLDSLDAWADVASPEGITASERFEATRCAVMPRLSLDLSGGRIRTIVWATGFRPDFGWLHLPVFDRRGGLVHDGGHVAPGLYALGLPVMRRRNSALLDGVGADAEAHADHIARQTHRRAA